MSVTVSMNVNGRAVSEEVEERTLLVEFLRENLRLTGTHVGCDTSQCGACVVHVDGRSVKACTMLANPGPGRRRDHHRGACGRRRSPSDAGSVPRQPRIAVRLLHTRHGHERTGSRRPQSRPERHRGSRVAGGEPLPLHRLSQHREVDPGRRKRDARRKLRWPRTASGHRSPAPRTSGFSPEPATTPTTPPLRTRPTPRSCARPTRMRRSRWTPRPRPPRPAWWRS